jgi:hypothetical protein
MITFRVYLMVVLASAITLVSCDKKDETLTPTGITDPLSLVKFSGDNQTVRVNNTLPARMVVLVSRGTSPVEDERVRFDLIAGNGNVFKPVSPLTTLSVSLPTDKTGKASATLRAFAPGETLMVRAMVVAEPTLEVTFTHTSIP